MIKVLTAEGLVALNRKNIISIEPLEEGTKIVFIPLPYSEEPVTIDSSEPYENILELFFSG